MIPYIRIFYDNGLIISFNEYFNYQLSVKLSTAACSRPTPSLNEATVLNTLGDLKMLLKSLPGLNDEPGAFASDLEDIRNDQPPMTMGNPWE